MMKQQLAGLMKQAQQMQDNMKKMQEQLSQVEVEGQSGAGLVKVTITCRNDVKRIAIDPGLLARLAAMVGLSRRLLDDRGQRGQHAQVDRLGHGGVGWDPDDFASICAYRS